MGGIQTMRPRVFLLLALGFTAVSAARAQIDFSGPGRSGDGLRGGGTGTRLAQFQPGISPLGSNLDLVPGQSVRLALYCADLFAERPTDRVNFTATGSDATVRVASGGEGTLGEAIAAGLIHARGRGSMDPVSRVTGQWFDAFLSNTSDQPLHVSLPAGTLLVPAGQSVPDVRPTVRRLFAAARERGLLGSNTLAHAVWATRSFTREDVEQTTMTGLSDVAARGVQELLAAADLGYQFDRGSGEYARLYERRRAEITEGVPVQLLSAPDAPSSSTLPLAARAAASHTGSAILPDGKIAHAELLADSSGTGLVKLTRTRGSGEFYYAGRIRSPRTDRLVVELLHLKTGRPLEAARAPILVKLASG
jgi:hypothetical protein